MDLKRLRHWIERAAVPIIGVEPAYTTASVTEDFVRDLGWSATKESIRTDARDAFAHLDLKRYGPRFKRTVWSEILKESALALDNDDDGRPHEARDLFFLGVRRPGLYPGSFWFHDHDHDPLRNIPGGPRTRALCARLVRSRFWRRRVRLPRG